MTAQLRESLSVFNEIQVKQNHPNMIELLRAKTQRYDHARNLFRLEVVLTVIAPAIGLVLAFIVPGVAPYAATYGILALATGYFLEQLQETATAQGAKVQELFDTELFGLDWPRDRIGEKPAPEDIAQWADLHRSAIGLYDWYAKEVAGLPLSLARIACQRSNGWWDSRMRNRYGRFLIAVAVATVLIVILGAVFWNGRMITVFELLFSLAPIMVWSARDAKKQLHLARERERIRERAEQVWRDALSGQLTGGDLDTAACELQADLYAQRRINAPVFAWVYSNYRDSSEEAMRVGVRQLVGEFERV